MSISEFAFNPSINKTTCMSLHKIVDRFPSSQPIVLISMVDLTIIACLSLHLRLHQMCMIYIIKLLKSINLSMPTINYVLILRRDLKLFMLVII